MYSHLFIKKKRGVEDKLQEDVQPTLENLRNAGIKIWMLTGDKVETATCIAISTGLKAPKDELFTIRDVDDPLQINIKLNEFSASTEGSKKSEKVLIIDGISLETALKHKEEYFF